MKSTTNKKINKAIKKLWLKRLMISLSAIIIFALVLSLTFLGNSSSGKGEEVIAEVEAVV